MKAGNRFCLPLMLTVLLASSACSTLGGFQEARVEKGEVGVMVGWTSQAFSHRDGGNPYYDLEGQLLPSLDFGIRYGFDENFEAGVLFSSFVPARNDWVATGIGIEGKAQVVRGEGFDAALQLGYRYSVVGLTDRDYDVRLNDLFLGGLLTWNLSPAVRMTLAPRVIQRSYRPLHFVSGSPSVPSDTGALTGALLTFSLGRDFRILPEAGWFTTDGVEIVHYGLGFVFLETP